MTYLNVMTVNDALITRAPIRTFAVTDLYCGGVARKFAILVIEVVKVFDAAFEKDA